MSKEFKLSAEAENLLTKLRDYMQDAELAEGVSRESLRNVRDMLKMAELDKADLEKQLAAAEKRAEEAEALFATARDALDPLRTDLEEYEGQPARELAEVLMADPEECGPRVCKASVLAALELLEKLEAANDAEARRYHGMTRDEHEVAKVLDDNGRRYCPTCADDAEARRDARMVGP